MTYPPLQEDRTPERTTVYWVLLVALLVGAWVLRDAPPVGGPILHTGLEVMATTLAAVVGILALVRYYSRKETTFLFIGTGFLGTAVLEVYHLSASTTFLTMPSVGDATPPILEWSWIASQLFLSFFLFLSWITWSDDAEEREFLSVDERSVYITATVLTVLVFVFFSRANRITAYVPDRPLHYPAELIPALFFAMAFVGYYLREEWRKDGAQYWLVVALLVSTLLHAAYAAFSTGPYDAYGTAAHVLKIFSYVAVLIGLLTSVFVTFRGEEAAYDATREANQALAREVGVRRQAEQVLQESEERLQDFLDSAHDLIHMTRPDGTLQYTNRAWRKILGYPPEELESRKLEEFVHPSSRRALEDAYARVLGGDTVGGLELTLVSSDGEEIPVRGGMNCRFEDGRPVSIRSVFRDVSEQKGIQEELARSQANVTALVESTGDAIWSVGRDHRLITFNDAFSLVAEALTGREPRVGDGPDATWPRDDAPRFGEYYARGLNGDRFSEVWMVDLAGQSRAFELYFNPIFEGFRTTGVVVFSKDVTRRVRAEEALRAAKDEAEYANQAKSQFLANMSHELRTPLNSVIGFANILLKRKSEAMDARERSFMERIQANGRHLLHLINEVLDLAKIESGRMDMEVESVDLQALVSETLEQLEGQLRGREVSLLSDVPVGVEPLETDRGKLKQVIINLVGNALKFTEKGSVTVRVETIPEKPGIPARIAVEDTGPGIPPERLEAIFEAFQQADGTTARQYGGTGLGLSISRSLCHLLGYHITVTSEVGTGSTFAINLNPRPQKEMDAWERELRPVPNLEGIVQPPVASRELGESDLLVRERVVEGETAEEAVVAPVSDSVTAADGGWPEPAQGSKGGRLDLAPASGGDGADRSPVILEGASSPGGERPARAPALGSPGSGPPRARVLVVDDDVDARFMLAHLLQGLGCEVYTADDGLEGLERAHALRPDLITMDLRMPRMSGWEVLQEIKSDTELQHIPVVIVTGEVQAGRGTVFGAQAMLPKPVDRATLSATLERALSGGAPSGAPILVVEPDDESRDRLTSILESSGFRVTGTGSAIEALREAEVEPPLLALVDPDLVAPDVELTLVGALHELSGLEDLPVVYLTDWEAGSEEDRPLIEKIHAALDPQGESEGNEEDQGG